MEHDLVVNMDADLSAASRHTVKTYTGNQYEVSHCGSEAEQWFSALSGMNRLSLAKCIHVIDTVKLSPDMN